MYPSLSFDLLWGEVLTAVTRNRVNTVNTRQVGEGEEGGLKHKV